MLSGKSLSLMVALKTSELLLSDEYTLGSSAGCTNVVVSVSAGAYLSKIKSYKKVIVGVVTKDEGILIGSEAVKV